MSNIKQQLFLLAQTGKVDELLEEAADGYGQDEESVHQMTGAVYQWMVIAEYYGSEEAGEIAEGIYEAELSHMGDEFTSELHFEIAQWFIEGVDGLPKEEELALEQLEMAEEFGFTKNVEGAEELLNDLKEKFSPKGQEQFDEIFESAE